MDLTGQKFGRLTVIEESERRGNIRRWRCACSCGQEKIVDQGNLRGGGSQSCGCFTRERTSATAKKHGSTRSPEHVVWVGMRQRCFNPKNSRYADYGGRGITVCERWQDFRHFIADMGERPTPKHQLDRIDNDGNYEPGNVRWATLMEQARNKGDNRWITWDGQKATISEWGRRTGIGEQLLGKRIDKLGWSVERALTTPVRYHPARK